MDNEELIFWTIYDHPKDFPHGYVARPWRVARDGATPLPQAVYGYTEAEVRRRLPPGLSCLGRSEVDDPVILETWL